MSIKYHRLILGLLSICIFSCEDPDLDLLAPTIEVVEYIPIPIEADICGTPEPSVFFLSGGDELVFDVVFKDNEALSQYKVDIHNNFDCHGHGEASAPSVAVPNVPNQTLDWTILDVQDISGSSAAIRQTLNVPDNVTAGNYHFQLQVVDESGNDTPSANIFALTIENPMDAVRPTIDVQLPIENSFSANRGSTVKFQGRVTDDRSLSDGGNGILFLSYTDLSSGNTFVSDAVFPFDSDIATTYDFDFDYTVPQTLVPGDYLFTLGANDGVRNVAPFISFEVEVRE